MDLDAVRTFVAAAAVGKFQDAADDLGITQQAVSKRIAALEKHLGAQLFTRTARGARLTLDGQTFLPHARKLLEAEQQALASLKPGNRPLRVDVINGFLAPAVLVRDFHREHPTVALDIVTLPDGATAIAALREGTIDATFRALHQPVDGGLTSVRVFDEPLQLLTGPDHPQADAKTLNPADLEGQIIWMPGNIAGTEWAKYYDELAAAFGFTIDTMGPNFGLDAMLDAMAESRDRATFVGEQTRFRWPDTYDLRRIDLHDPTPVYPHSLIWRTTNPHPALATLHSHLIRHRHPATTPLWWARNPQRPPPSPATDPPTVMGPAAPDDLRAAPPLTHPLVVGRIPRRPPRSATLTHPLSWEPQPPTTSAPPTHHPGPTPPRPAPTPNPALTPSSRASRRAGPHAEAGLSPGGRFVPVDRTSSTSPSAP